MKMIDLNAGKTTEKKFYCADAGTVFSSVIQSMVSFGWNAPAAIVADGSIHRFSTKSGDSSDKSGWYIAHTDSIPCVIFGDWRSDEKQVISGTDPEFRNCGVFSAISQSEIQKNKEWVENQQRLAREKRAKEDAEAVARSLKRYNAARPCDPRANAYLFSKGITSAPDARVNGEELLVPLYNPDGSFGGVQSIYPSPDKMTGFEKRFAAGMALKGRFAWLHGSGSVAYICEGYATACSIYEATGADVFAAMNAGNIVSVTPELVSRFHDKKFIICADNDRWGLRNGVAYNTGVENAKKAGKASGCSVIIPEFSSLDGNPTDFNDLHVRQGIEAVRTQLNCAVQDVPNILDWGIDNFTGETPEQKWLVKDTLPMGAPCVLAASGGTGKGMLALDLALTVASCPDGGAATGNLNLNQTSSLLSGKWLGMDVVEHGTVVIFTAEDSKDDVHRRLATLDPDGSRRENARGRLFIVPLPNAGGPIQIVQAKDGYKSGFEPSAKFSAIMEQLAAIHDLKMINIDPLAAFCGVDINSDPQAGQYVQGLLANLAAKTGACVVTAHHMSKPTGSKKYKDYSAQDAREAIRGTTALVDGVRLALAIWPADTKTIKRVQDKNQNEKIKAVDVFFGAVVKANCQADMSVRVLVRRNGLLMAVESDSSATEASFEEDLNALEKAVKEKVEWGAPFSANTQGMMGVWKRRTELPGALRGYSRRQFEDLIERLLSDGRVVTCIDGKQLKWLDVPGGYLATDPTTYEFRQGSTNIKATKPQWSGGSF